MSSFFSKATPKAVAAVTAAVVQEHGLDVAAGLLAVAKDVPFVGPFASLLKACMDLCDRTNANKAAVRQYRERLLEVAALVQTALDTVGKRDDVQIIEPYTKRLTDIIADSMDFIASHTNKNFLMKMLANKDVETRFADLDKRLAEVMHHLSVAVGLAQYRIAARTYEVFDAQAFLRENGGAAAVQRDEEKLAELASRLECSIDDLQDGITDYFRLIERKLEEMHLDLRAGFEEMLRRERDERERREQEERARREREEKERREKEERERKEREERERREKEDRERREREGKERKLREKREREEHERKALLNNIRVVEDKNPGQIKVVNKTNLCVYVRVTSYSSNGQTHFIAVSPRSDLAWKRPGYEGVFIAGDSKGMQLYDCLYVKSGSMLVVDELDDKMENNRLTRFPNFSVSSIPADIVVRNTSREPVMVSVSSFSNPRGDSKWFQLLCGHTEVWGRSGLELVVVVPLSTFSDPSTRMGIWMRGRENLVIS